MRRIFLSLIIAAILAAGFLTSCESEEKKAAEQVALLKKESIQSLYLANVDQDDPYWLATRMRVPDNSFVAGEVIAFTATATEKGSNIYNPLYQLRVKYGENNPINFTVNTLHGTITAISPPDKNVVKEVLGATNRYDRFSAQIMDGGSIYEFHIMGLPGWEAKDAEFWGFTGWPGEPTVAVAEEPVVPPHPQSLQGLAATLVESGKSVTLYRHFPDGSTKTLKVVDIKGHGAPNYEGLFRAEITGPRIPGTASSYWKALGHPRSESSSTAVFWIKGTDWEVREMVSATFTPDQPLEIVLNDESIINTSSMR